MPAAKEKFGTWGVDDGEAVQGTSGGGGTRGANGAGVQRRAAAYRQTHARILLLCDENQADGAMKDEDIARALQVGTATVERVRRRCVEEGLGRRQQLNRRQRKLDGAGEARLIALTCSQPPEGRASWTLRLLAGQLLECEIVGSISTETVRQTLKKANSSPG